MTWLFFLGKQRKMLGERKDESIYFLPLGTRAVKRVEEMSVWDLELAEDEQRDAVVVSPKELSPYVTTLCYGRLPPPTWVYSEQN